MGANHPRRSLTVRLRTQNLAALACELQVDHSTIERCERRPEPTLEDDDEDQAVDAS
jgi:hypothetical protein